MPLTLLLALFIAASPLLGVVPLLNLPWDKQSAWCTAFATLGVGLLGGGSALLAVFICASGLVRAMPGDGPKCVTGAAVFFPVGVLFTFIAFLIGLRFTLRRIG
jgi:hypothetical protein